MRAVIRREDVLRNPRLWVPVSIVMLVAAWNIYISLNDDGLVTGWVVDEAGSPLAGVTVEMQGAGTVGSRTLQRAVTGRNGSFRFAGHGQHRFRLQARDAHDRPGTSVEIRLYFRNQNFIMDSPLRLPMMAAVRSANDGVTQ